MIIFVLAAVCSWEKSLKAHEFLSKSLGSLLSTHQIPQYSLPSDCPFRIQEKADKLEPFYSYKRKVSHAVFECTACNKQFRSEKVAEDHIINFHAENAEGICFADFCYFLPCDKDDEILLERCKNVMADCFDDNLIEETLSLCRFQEPSI